MTQRTLTLEGGPTGLELAVEPVGQHWPIAAVDDEATPARTRDAGIESRRVSRIVVGATADSHTLANSMTSGRSADSGRRTGVGG